MSESQPSTSINPFLTKTTPSGIGVNAVRVTNSYVEAERSFSNELSRASERNNVSSTERWVDRSAAQPDQQHAGSTRQPGDEHRSMSQADQSPTRNSTSQSSKNVSDSQGASEKSPDRSISGGDAAIVRKVKKRSAGAREKNDTADAKVRKTDDKPNKHLDDKAVKAVKLKSELPDSVPSQVVTETGEALESKTGNTLTTTKVGGRLAIKKDGETITLPSEKTSALQGEKASETNVRNAAGDEKPAIASDRIRNENEDKKSHLDSTTLLNRRSKVASEALTHGNSQSRSVTEGSEESSIPMTKPLELGEKMSPSQLATRQKHLYTGNSLDKVERPTIAKAQQLPVAEVAEESSGKEAIQAAKVVTVSSAPMLEGTRGLNGKSLTELAQKLGKPSSRSGQNHSSSEISAAESALAVNRKAEELDSAAQLEAFTKAREVAKNSKDQQFTHDKQVQKMQDKQVQAQQISQTSMQGNSVSLAPLTAEPAIGTNQSTDNMFHSMPGGIVTAPVIPKQDAGNTQTINAPINIPILQNDADKALAGNIRWMVNEGVKNAVVNVTPSGMGPISVSIGMEKDQMNISIVAHQGSTREALDSMLPKLREQFASQGQDNIRVDISDGRSEQSQRGYAQQFTGENNGSERNESGFENSRSTDQFGEERGSDVGMTSSGPQGLFTINENGQIRSRYDAYV